MQEGVVVALASGSVPLVGYCTGALRVAPSGKGFELLMTCVFLYLHKNRFTRHLVSLRSLKILNLQVLQEHETR